MNLKLISVPALCLVAGVAFAQESGSNPAAPATRRQLTSR